MNENKNWLIYLLQCANNALYCGITNDINKRLRQHNGEITGKITPYLGAG
jgi:putative endonuclease